MAHTYEELKHKTVAELREIAHDIEHEAVQGYTQMNKEHLIVALCKALHIDMHQHRHVVGLNKAEIKAKLKTLKAQRDAAIEAHDHTTLQTVRREMHSLKVKLHRAAVLE